MAEIIDESKGKIVTTIPITEGMKIYATDIKSFYEIISILERVNYVLITNINNYSIYIASTLSKTNDSLYQIK